MKNEIKLFQRLGFYQPAFFHIHLDTEESILGVTPINMSSTLSSVFFHEYIHFLQDITTVYGLQNIYSISEYIKYCACIVAPQGNFQVPVVLKDNAYNVRANHIIRTLAFGDSGTSDTLHINSYSIEKIKDDDLIQNKIPYFPTVKIEAEEGIFSFGARELMESSAYILQRKCTNSPQSPEFPYCAAEKLAAYICPEIFNDDMFVLALCDACLVTSQPGAVFVKVAEHIKQHQSEFPSPESVYDYVFGLSPLEFFETSINLVKDALKSYFDIPQISNNLNSWIDLVFDFAKEWRQKQKYCLLLLARGGTLKQNKLFANTINKIGSPLISNNLMEHTRFAPNPDYGDFLQYLHAMLPVVHIFDGDFDCCLYNFCQYSKKDVDERCHNNPWTRCNDTNLCPVACFLKHRKMANIAPYI